jgi:hypothetical protein
MFQKTGTPMTQASEIQFLMYLIISKNNSQASSRETWRNVTALQFCLSRHLIVASFNSSILQLRVFLHGCTFFICCALT